MGEIRTTNLRLNLEKPIQRQAWEYLQTMDKAVFKSYSQAIATALVDYFDRYYKKQEDPYLETRAREERFVQQIVTAVEQAMVAAIAAVGLTNRGVKRNNWAVINQARRAGASSALLEICFIDDPDDMAVYAAKQSDIVEAIAMSIIDGFGLQRPEPEQEETMTGKEIYDALNAYTATVPVPDWAKKEL